nr:hypothetical protein [Dechloromonas sp.]
MSDYVPRIPEAASCEEMRDYFEWHVQHGYAKDKVFIDRRGLEFLREKHRDNLGLGIPPDGETSDPKTGRIYVRAIY